MCLMMDLLPLMSAFVLIQLRLDSRRRLSDDIYYFRIRNNNSAWSNTIEVEVKHHSLSRAFGFFSLGAVMLIVTLIVLIKGARGRN